MPRAGIEPATRGFSVLCSTNWAIGAYWVIPNPSSGNRIWTYDLRVMSPTSFQTAPSRVIRLTNGKNKKPFGLLGGEGFEPSKALPADLQSVPFGHSGIHPFDFMQIKKPIGGLEPSTCWLQISCSANWAISAYFLNGTYRARTCDPLLVRQMLSQLS